MNPRGNLEIDIQGVEMCPAAGDFAILGITPFARIVGALCFADQVEVGVYLGNHGPVRVVIAQRGGNDEPAGELAEEFDVHLHLRRFNLIHFRKGIQCHILLDFVMRDE